MGALQFATFTLDLSQPVLMLMRAGKEVPLRPQALKVLAYLAERSGQIVTNSELIEGCWEKPKQTNINSLAQCIKDIREALGETDQPIIRTVPRQGYIFAAPVSTVPPTLPRAAPEISPRIVAVPREVGLEKDAALPDQWHRAVIAAGLLITVLVAGGWLLWQALHPKPAPALAMTTVPTIAVLPIKTLGDHTDAALATLPDEIAVGISRAPRAYEPVIQPTSAVKNAQDDPKAIGRNLGVRYVVRSLARRESDQLHVTVQLIEAPSARHVWARDFDYRVGEPKAQSRTAARIGQTLAAEILRAEVQRPLPAKPEAGHFVMLGRKLITDEDNAKANAAAIAYFEKALAADPKHFHALVHYARATARHRLIGWMRESEVDERLGRAEAAIDLAITLNPNAAGAHITRGSVLRAKGEHGLAIDAFERTLELDPNFFPALAELGRALIDVGRAEDAITKLKKGIEASPTDISPHFWYYWLGLAALHLPNRHEDALIWLGQSLAANPHHDNTYRLMAVALADAGREEEAREKVQKFLNLRPSATLDDWRMPNSRSLPDVAARRAHMRATLQRLGVPETAVQAASKP